MSKAIKENIIKYKHGLLMLYFLVYLPWFAFLNIYTPGRSNVTYIHHTLDDYIPFLEVFAIMYFIWFLYVAVAYIFFFFASREEFIRLCIFLYTGMTLSLIIYTLFPNGQQLRVDYDTLGRSNFLIDAMRSLQATDSPYNVFPSIHCLNSIGVHIAVQKSKCINKCRTPIVILSLIISILIILSTVFVKQHSVLDVFAAVVISVPLYFLAYKTKLHN